MPLLMLLAASSCAGGLKYPAGPMECARPQEHGRAEKLVFDGFHLSPTGRYLAVATSRGVALYRTGTLELVWFAPTWHWVREIAWSPDGSRIASSDASSCIFLWDAATGRNVQQLCGHSHEAVRVSWSDRPDHLASGAGSYDSRYGEVLFWNTETKKPVHVLKGVFQSQSHVKWPPKGSMLVTWSIHGDEIVLRDAESFQIIRKLKMPENVMNVYWSTDGTKLASPAPFYNDELIIWDAGTGDKVTVLSCNVGSMDDEGVAWGPDGSTIAAVVDLDIRTDVEEKQTVMLWNAQTGEKLREFPGHAFAFSPNGGAVAVAAADEALMVWDIRSGELQRRLTELPKRAESVGWSKNGDAIVAEGGGWITAWNAETGERISSIDGSGLEE